MSCANGLSMEKAHALPRQISLGNLHASTLRGCFFLGPPQPAAVHCRAVRHQPPAVQKAVATTLGDGVDGGLVPFSWETGVAIPPLKPDKQAGDPALLFPNTARIWQGRGGCIYAPSATPQCIVNGALAH
ncbi:hypothetical protein TraAM80_09477 [Trypanosoma rangeli]|uniref:Uncharacterized protein n=1 Tax=Trypanosoma rangeli TaxID=5698 RepID=A0A3R7LH31_TRYRA|nr:uncharacterized protein TraAM80_09477 [Trypanosoma rangeli]RNE97153.1 hypothetical protein TraAM80_09477 [Trypanosoma rangeli]|eukprot:RNE97153.1 hypothetical protein TraAM80_09477 [Trypanosoma rangeli]